MIAGASRLVAIAVFLFLADVASVHNITRVLTVELRDQQCKLDTQCTNLAVSPSERVQGTSSTNSNHHTVEVKASSSDQPKVLLAIVSSRAQLHTRAKAIMETWAKDVPNPFIPMIFVGDAENNGDGIESGSQQDVDRLRRTAGIQNTSKVKVVVMEGIPDNEYPPVLKNTGMVKQLNEIAESLEANGEKVGWAFKVDDDAYVHFGGLLSFLKTRDSTKDGFYGQRGMGRPADREGIQKSGLGGPYCLGGPGWIMSRSTLHKAAIDMDQCVDTVDKSKYRQSMWHSDTVIGPSVKRTTGKNCWTDDDYWKVNVPFRHNRNATLGSHLDSELPTIAVLHPFKDPKVMAQLHVRFQKAVQRKMEYPLG